MLPLASIPVVMLFSTALSTGYPQLAWMFTKTLYFSPTLQFMTYFAIF